MEITIEGERKENREVIIAPINEHYSADINLDDVCYAIYNVDANSHKRIFIDRIKWNIGEWQRMRRINEFSKKRHGNPARRLWKKLKLRNIGICQRISNEIIKNAFKIRCKSNSL
jgi:hypothetical protein